MKEIERLHEMLLAEGIDHEWIDRTPNVVLDELIDWGYQIIVWREDVRIVSVVQGFGTYGNDSNLLEIMGLLTPEEKKYGDVAGWLTAGDVFSRIKAAVSVTV